MKISVPSPLRSYTSGRAEVVAGAQVAPGGLTLASLLADLDAQYPGIRFRMIDEQDRVRPHVRFFVNGEMQRELTAVLSPEDSVQIVCALSGG